jgi:glycosyltransferase involved in cell wall biosynthesis
VRKAKVVILQINSVCNSSNSTGRTTFELTEAINAAGHDGYVAYGEGYSDYPNAYFIGNILDHKIHAFLSRLTGLQGYFSNLATKKLINHIESISPDIVHLRNLHSNYINIHKLIKYLATNNIAVVLTLHDCFFYTGKCAHYTNSDCDGWKKECGNCPRLQMDNKSWYFDRTKKMLMDKRNSFNSIPRLAVVGVSEWITKEAKSSILSKATYLETIYNWVDIEVFKPTKSNLREELNLEDKFVILGVASLWNNSKGLDDFIDIANRLDNRFSILLVGKLSEDIILPANVLHIKRTNSVSKLVKYYSLADVFFNPSIEESFGKVTVESLACGTPVIVYKTTACPELVGDRCGGVVDLYDIKGVYKLVMEMYSNKKPFYSSSCVSFVHKKFTKKEGVKKYLKMYKKLISKC